MGKHNNPSIVQAIQRILNPKLGQQIASEVADILQPVIIVGNVVNVLPRVAVTTSGSATIFTTPVDKDFYLTGWNMTQTQDVVSDSTSLDLRCILHGESARVIDEIEFQTLTAQSVQSHEELHTPILIDRATAITINNDFTVGTARKTANIRGFTVEVVSTATS